MSSNLAFSNSTSERYALALYELAKEKSELEKTETEINSLKELFVTNSDFGNMVSNPIIARKDQVNSILKISEYLNFSNTFKNFLGLVTSKGRLFYLKQIIDSFLKIVSVKKGELTAEFSSSKELTNNEIDLIQKDLSSHLKCKLKIICSYNPDLIGGFTIKIGSTMIDTSIKNKLKRLEQIMIES